MYNQCKICDNRSGFKEYKVKEMQLGLKEYFHWIKIMIDKAELKLLDIYCDSTGDTVVYYVTKYGKI